MSATGKNKTNCSNLPGTSPGKRATTPLFPVLVAAGGVATIIASPASALELGELTIDSSLGQPLRASIAYALNPHEELYDFCVSLNRGAAASGLPALTKAKISVADNRITLRGNIPIKEPLLSMRLTVDCPYTAHLARDYMLMINPPAFGATANRESAATVPPVAASIAASSASQPSGDVVEQKPAPRPASRPAPERSIDTPAATETPIQIGSRYRVQVGDSLSEIASRVADRPIGLWPAVEAIFLANPQAFTNSDMNRLKAGSMLVIPAMQDSPAMSSEQLPGQSVSGESNQAIPAAADSGFDNAAYDGYTVTEPAPDTATEKMPVEDTAEPATVSEFAAESPDETAAPGSGTDVRTPADTMSAEPMATAQPGDVFVNSNVPSTAPAESAGESSIPVDSTPAGSATSRTWLKWLAGSGIALILGLLVFGRRLRERLGGDAAGGALPAHDRRATDNDATQNAEALADVDFPFDETAPGDRAIILDADLGEGTGLQTSGQMDVAQDFGFAAGGEQDSALDMEITVEATDELESIPTDIIPTQRTEPESILDSEIPPNNDDDGEYDLSMIVDATKQAIGDMEDTAKDLMAIPLESATTKEDENAYTLSKEIDYKILEQDYEDELTATQALNKEIARAALELAERMDAEENGEGSPANNDPTVEMPAKNAVADDRSTRDAKQSPDSELTAELTAKLPVDANAENDDFISDLDDTGINEELTADMPLGEDPTVDIESHTATVDTKKIAGQS